MEGAWYGAYRGEEWLLRQRPPGGDAIVPVSLHIRIVAPPEYDVTPALLEPVVREILAARAPWVRLDTAARHRLELAVELRPMAGEPRGYQGWVRMTFRRGRWVPAVVTRPPDWTDRVLVLAVPPDRGSYPRDNVRGATRILVRNFIALALLREWGLRIY